MQLINRFQMVEGMTDADKDNSGKSHPHILFKNGMAIRTWKNMLGVEHVFITDRSGTCVYGGYVGWLHSKQLQDALQSRRDDLKEYIA